MTELPDPLPEKLYVRNWPEFQHYSERNPPWIKLYPRLLNDDEFALLTDAQKYHLLGIFMLASKSTDGSFLTDNRLLNQGLKSTVDVDLNAITHWITDTSDASIVIAKRKRKAIKKIAPCKRSLDQRIEIRDQRSETENMFEQFYQSYPRHQGKAAAMNAWKKLNPDSQLQSEIMTAVEKQKGWPDWTKNNGQFIPYPATWLNQRRWEDEPTTSGLPPSGNSPDIEAALQAARSANGH